MNIIKYIKAKAVTASVCLMLLLAYSCGEDFINVIPEDSIDKSSFFKNEIEVRLALNGAYRTQTDFYGNRLSYQLRDGRSDDTAIDQLDQPERIDTETFEEVNNSQIVVEQWLRLYNIINHANGVIIKGPEAVPVGPDGQDLIDRYIAEAKFLRALAYYEIVIHWGGNAPLRLTPAEDFGEIVPSSTTDAIYNQIAQDLADAAAGLPDSYSGNDVGRATRYAALSLLGKVELQRGDAGAALTAFRQVEGNYSLLPDYADLYAPGNDNHAESIFEISFNKTDISFGLANELVHNSEMDRLGLIGGTGRANLLFAPTNDLIAAFSNPADLRAASTFGFENDDPTDIAYITKFIDGNETGAPDINQIIIRYADVLLGIAEALGEGSEAYEYINRVRRRGYGLDPNAGDPTIDIDASTPGTFNEKLLNERRLELAFESGHRWKDFLRLTSPSDAVTQLQAHLLNQVGRNVSLSVNNLLYPIPFREIELGEGLINQNPGHE